MLWKTALVLLLLYVLLQLALTLSSWRRPALGLVKDTAGEMRLAACPSTPNCVCSEPDHAPDTEHAIQPLPTGDDPAADFERLKAVCTELRFVLVKEQADYLRFESITPLARYVDDLEFRLDETAKVIHIRSASRVGKSDLGANRKRVERVREAFRLVSD